MKMRAKGWKKILVVITDPFARTQPALAKAAAVARRCRAKLILFNSFIVPQPVNDVPSDSREAIIAAAIRQRIARLRSFTRAMGVRGARCIVAWDHPAYEAIVRQVLAHKPQLLITDSHRHGRLARIVLANTDWELMRTCPCPMWFVRSASLPRSPRILVAVDPLHSHSKPARLDDRLLDAAGAIVEQLGGRRAIVHAYETPASAFPGMLMEPIRLPISPQRTRDAVLRTTMAVNRLADRHDIAPADRTIAEGWPATVIPAAVRRTRTDVLVMGAVSRRLLARPVIGGTAERVIDHVDCDVFVVKPAGFKTPVPRLKRR
jgi:universal stress protein E